MRQESEDFAAVEVHRIHRLCIAREDARAVWVLP
jgi:hypothetical protein